MIYSAHLDKKYTICNQQADRVYKLSQRLCPTIIWNKTNWYCERSWLLQIKQNSDGKLLILILQEGGKTARSVLLCLYSDCELICCMCRIQNHLVQVHSVIQIGGRSHCLKWTTKPQSRLHGLCEPKHGTQDQEGQGCNSGLQKQHLYPSIPPAFLQKREKDLVCLFTCGGRQGHKTI